MHQLRRRWTAPALAIAAAALGAGCATTPATTTAASTPQATATSLATGTPLAIATPLTTATEHRPVPSMAGRPTAVSQGIGGSRDSSHRAGSSGGPAAGVALPAATTRATSAAAGVGIPAAHQPAPPVAAVPPPVAAVPPPVGGGHGGGSGGGRAAAPALPVDFPRAVPIPPGTLLGGSGSAGQWGVLVLADGPADQVLKSAVAFYVAAGYTADGPAIVHRGIYRVTIVAENRDHSNTKTNLALGVTRT